MRVECFDWEHRYEHSAYWLRHGRQVAMLLAEVGLEPTAIAPREAGGVNLIWWDRALSEDELHQVERANVLANRGDEDAG